MRLIFYYVAYKHGPGETCDINRESKDNYYANRVQEEGYFLLLKKISELDYIEEVIIVIESRQDPGTMKCSDKMKIIVVPDINQTRSFIKEGDVLWIRGGWKHWHDYLIDMKDQGHWLMIYAANTGRQKWAFWDVVLDDLSGSTYYDSHNRLIYDFRKPISEHIFRVFPNTPLRYDICIGASRIHDKKGQWRVVNALLEYSKAKGRKLKAILPGPWTTELKTNTIKRLNSGYSLNIKFTDSVSRQDLAQILNESKVFVHMGSHGQGDRGVMEAMACGCNIMIGFKQYHAPWIFDTKEKFVVVPRNPNNFQSLSQSISETVFKAGNYDRRDIADHYYMNAGLSTEAFPRMKKLLDFFENPNRVII